LTEGQAPDWGLAIAFPARGFIVMRSPRLVSGSAPDVRQVLFHELMHLYLGRALGDSSRAAPGWFHEGLASLYAGEWGWSERFSLALALVGRQPIGLRELEASFPAAKVAADLAYLESLVAVSHLRSLGGEEGLRLLIGRLRDGESFDRALRETYGMTYGQFEEGWKRFLVTRYGWAMVASSTWTYWTPAAALLFLLYLFRRLRYRERLGKMREAERRAVLEASGGGMGSVGPGEEAAQTDPSRAKRAPLGAPPGEIEKSAGSGGKR